MEIRTERLVYAVTQYIKESKKISIKTIEKAPVYTSPAIEMADEGGERINYKV